MPASGPWARPIPRVLESFPGTKGICASRSRGCRCYPCWDDSNSGSGRERSFMRRQRFSRLPICALWWARPSRSSRPQMRMVHSRPGAIVQKASSNVPYSRPHASEHEWPPTSHFGAEEPHWSGRRDSNPRPSPWQKTGGDSRPPRVRRAAKRGIHPPVHPPCPLTPPL
jgi:hypothetical protein